MASLLPRVVAAALILPGTVAVLIPAGISLATQSPAERIPEGWRWLGAAPAILGLALGTWSVACFATQGKGTLAPWDAPVRLVIRGPFRLSRNPMYVGVVGVLIGEAVLLGSPWLALYAIAVALGFHLRVVIYEEPVLLREFGDEFIAYCRRVRRWFGVRSSQPPR